MDFDNIIKDIESKIETSNIKLSYINSILTENKVEDIFTFMLKALEKSSIIDNYFAQLLRGKNKYTEDEIYKRFGDINGGIIYVYASIKNILLEDNLNYTFEETANLSADNLFFKELSDIPTMKRETSIAYVIKFQEYKELYEKAISKEEKEYYQKKYIFYQNQVIEGNLRLIVSIANKHLNCGLEKLDLINEGTIGMIKAMEKYNASLGFLFSTYATYWVRQYINRAILNKGRTIRIPINQHIIYNKYLEALKILSYKLDKEPSLEEIASFLHMETDALSKLLMTFSENISLDAPLNPEEHENSSMYQFLKSGEFEDDSINILTLNQLLSCLNDEERKIITLRFIENKTLEEVSKIYNVTRETIRQKEKKALEKMRACSKVIKISLLEYLPLKEEDIYALVLQQESSAQNILYKNFGNNLTLKVVPSKFNQKDIKLVIDKMLAKYYKCIKEQEDQKYCKTLIEFLNDYNKETLEYEEMCKRIKFLWETQDKSTIIYQIMVKAFGKEGTNKCNYNLLSKYEKTLFHDKLTRWKYRMKRVNFWPSQNNTLLEKAEAKKKSKRKALWELLNVTIEELSIIINSLNKDTKFYQMLIKYYGSNFDLDADLTNMDEKDKTYFYNNITSLRRKVNEPTPFLRKKLNEILECEIESIPGIQENLLLKKAFGENLDQPYLNQLNVHESKNLILLIKGLQKRLDEKRMQDINKDITKSNNAKTKEEVSQVYYDLVNVMPDEIRKPFMLYFGLVDGTKYSTEDIALSLNINLSAASTRIQRGITFIKKCLDTYQTTFGKTIILDESILKRLK